MKAKKAVLIGGVVLAIPFGLIGVLAAFNRKTEIRNLGQEFMYDDFGFSAMSYCYANSVGTSTASGTYLILSVRVRNHAIRVPYTFKTASAIIQDAAGHEYKVDSQAQAAFEAAYHKHAPGDDPIPPGSERTFDLVFQIPGQLESPRFRVSEGGALGDILDFFIFGRKLALLDSTGGAKP